jgi:hypothetical protein
MSPTPRQIPVAVDLTEMKKSTDGKVRWLWEGYAAYGSITLFTSRWKSGKTTLLSVLLSRLSQGGTVAGSAVKPSPALVVSEEAPAIWVARGQKLAFGSNVKWICQPFLGNPNSEQWYDLMYRLRDHRLGMRQPTLVVIDPLVSVLPNGNENSAKAIIAALTPLRILAEKDTAVMLLHHPNKSQSLDPRGSGALASFADILMELEFPHNAGLNDRRRWLRVRGRHDVAPSERLIEWNAAGDDYIVRDPVAEDYDDGLQMIRAILSDARRKYTRQEICADWPESRDKPHRATLHRWLHQAADRGLIRRDGKGRNQNPYRYWLPEREQFFVPDLPEMEEVEAEVVVGG